MKDLQIINGLADLTVKKLVLVQKRLDAMNTDVLRNELDDIERGLKVLTDLTKESFDLVLNDINKTNAKIDVLSESTHTDFTLVGDRLDTLTQGIATIIQLLQPRDTTAVGFVTSISEAV